MDTAISIITFRLSLIHYTEVSPNSHVSLSCLHFQHWNTLLLIFKLNSLHTLNHDILNLTDISTGRIWKGREWYVLQDVSSHGKIYYYYYYFCGVLQLWQSYVAIIMIFNANCDFSVHNYYSSVSKLCYGKHFLYLF